VLVTERAVLHGSPQKPCVAAFDAKGAQTFAQQFARRARSEPEVTAIVPTFDMAHSWAFQETKVSDWQSTVQARPMSCRFDPSLTIPREALPRIEGPSADADSR
jgi:hypothetical protein